jgi:hypothetical protein
VDPGDAWRGGAEGDIRSLFYWSRAAFYILVAAGVLWVVLGAYRLYVGLTWVELDSMTGSTQSTNDIAWGIAFLAAAAMSFVLARWLNNDVVTIFSTRRFQVPREKLLVYSMLALPFGFVLAGALLILVNVKLSHPEFLPSHAEAYPSTMPGFVMVPSVPKGAQAEAAGEVLIPEGAPRELAPLGFDEVPVTLEEAGPAPVFMEEMPAKAGPMAAPAPARPPAGAAPMAAYVEEVPVEDIPEVVAQVVPAPGAPQPAPVEAYYEEVPLEEVPPAEAVGFEAIVEEVPLEEVPPAEAVGFEAIVEDVPPEELGDFEEVPLEEAPTAGEVTKEPPRTIEDAHEELLGKLLGK